MNIHLIDGTYELFRNYYGAPKRTSPDGREAGATVGLLRSLIALVSSPGVTHVACAFDHVIESFRNDLYAGYKTGDGIEPELFNQFHPAEEAVAALGITVWPMVEFEADDALASAAAKFRNTNAVKQILMCSPDKDLAQCVRGKKVVCFDRRREIILDEGGVEEKFGVSPESIPDWLALVGDAADGYPGVKGWGAKSAAALLAKFRHIESIPNDPARWNVNVSRAETLSRTLEQCRDDALLFRTLATLREDVPIEETLADLEWHGAEERLQDICVQLGVKDIAKRVQKWRK